MKVERQQDISAIGAMSDPLRRSVYDYISKNRKALSRDEIAEGLGVPRATIAFHLEKLVAEGLLDFEFKRLGGRTGPGAGRPSKLYSRTQKEISVSIPQRQYDIAGHLLATAIERSELNGEAVRDSLNQVSHDEGVSLGKSAESLDSALTQCGYEPYQDEHGNVLLANCPFHQLSTGHTDLICGANVELVKGMISGSGAQNLSASLTPNPGGCCVRIALTSEVAPPESGEAKG
ncbi:MAG: helix-turn-helix domain-containing protein [Microbacteriaceae bacterium]